MKAIDTATDYALKSFIQVYFANDISRNLGNTKEPLVVFLDSYEKISNAGIMDNIATDWLIGKDGLFKKIPNTIWVVFGTEPLDCSDDRINLIKAPELTNFDEKFSKEYLTEYGINDVTIQSYIINATKGIPKLLNLAYCQYEMCTELNQKSEYDMEKDVENWITTLLDEGFDASEKEYIYIFATLQLWNDDNISDIYPEYRHREYVKCVKKLISLGFVVNDGDRYYFKKSFLDLLKNYTVENFLNVKKEISEKAIKYYKDAIKTMTLPESSLGEYLLSIVRQYTNLGEPVDVLAKEYFCFLSVQIRRLIEVGRIAETIKIFEFINGKLTHFLEDQNELATLVLIDYSMMRRCKGELPEARKCIDMVLDNLNVNTCYACDEYVIRAYEESSSVYYFNSEFTKAIASDEFLLEFKKERYGEDNITTLWTCFYLATSYNQVGKQKRAQEILKDIINKLDTVYPNTEKVLRNRVRHHLAIVSEMLGNNMEKEDALKIKLELLPERISTLGLNHMYTLKMQYSIARSYFLLKNYNMAISLCKKTITRQEKILGLKHPDVLKSKRLLACCLREIGENVIDMLAEIEKDFAEEFGAHSRETLKTTIERIITIQRNGNRNQTEELARKSLQITKENGYDESDEIVTNLKYILSSQ